MPWPPRPGPTPTPTGPPVELSVAKIAARAAIGGAVIAVVGAAAGAIIAGLLQDGTAKTSFVRTQQQSAYATFLTDQQAFLDASEKAVFYFKPADAAKAQAEGEKLTVVLHKLNQDSTNIRVIGSDESTRAASEIIDADNKVAQYISGGKERSYIDQGYESDGGPAIDEAGARIILHNVIAGASYDQVFVVAVRHDLGTQ